MLAFFLYAYGVGEISSLDFYEGLILVGFFFIAAFLMRQFGKSKLANLTSKDAIFSVTLTWLLIVILGTIPFLFYGENWVNAFFESTSGFTTTGSTIFAQIDTLPKSLLLWRSTSQWIGGMGIIVLFVTIIPSLGKASKMLFRSEVPGPVKENLTPHLRDTAKQLWILYLALTIILIVIYKLLGLTYFDSINHAFTTIATAGFSTKNESMAFFSPQVQWVAIIFMTLGGINFGIFLLLITPNRRKILQDSETKFYLIMIFLGSLVFTAIYFLSQGNSLSDSLRISFFTVVSIVTTTGYTNVNMSELSFGLQALLIIFFFLGGCGGSTSGGIKMYRILLTLRSLTFQIKKSLDPYLISSIKIAKVKVEDNVVLNVFIFVLVYLFFFFLGSILFFIDTQDFYSSFSLAASSIGNVGPSLGNVGSEGNLAMLSDFAKLLSIFLMLLGRLELFTIITLFHPLFWKRY